jgi:hypothetical protein
MALDGRGAEKRAIETPTVIVAGDGIGFGERFGAVGVELGGRLDVAALPGEPLVADTAVAVAPLPRAAAGPAGL